ncbi:MAG: dephospho-CoA kinase [Bacteriovoracaceae bacterium]|nr:dephospho-CoA kinase [Bacteriovoracaceae bacterium]
MSLLKLKSKYCKLAPEQRLYNLDRPLVGLTGGIATGKSTVSKLFKERGAYIIDADALVKAIYKDNETIDLVKELAPKAISGHKIDFKELRVSFFTDPNIKNKLENHIYKRLPEEFLKEVEKSQPGQLLIYDVPLLFEKAIDSKVDLSILVYAPKEIQIKRMQQRDGVELQLARTILANQMPIDEKKAMSDFILENTSDIKELEREVNSLVSVIS